MIFGVGELQQLLNTPKHAGTIFPDTIQQRRLQRSHGGPRVTSALLVSHGELYTEHESLRKISSFQYLGSLVISGLKAGPPCTSIANLHAYAAVGHRWCPWSP